MGGAGGPGCGPGTGDGTGGGDGAGGVGGVVIVPTLRVGQPLPCRHRGMTGLGFAKIMTQRERRSRDLVLIGDRRA